MNEAQIARIIQQVTANLSSELKSSEIKSVYPIPPAIFTRPRTDGGRGVHATVDQAVQAAHQAFQALRDCSLANREKYIQAMRRVMLSELQTLAKMAVEETGLGRVSDKKKKPIGRK